MFNKSLKFAHFSKIWKRKKSDICVIFAWNHGWLRNWRPTAKLGEGLCSPRPGPKTATEHRVHPMADCPLNMPLELADTSYQILLVIRMLHWETRPLPGMWSAGLLYIFPGWTAAATAHQPMWVVSQVQLGPASQAPV